MKSHSWDARIIEFIDGLPLWAIFVASTILVLVFTELGFQLGRRARGRSTTKITSKTASVVGSSLGLLALILAFAFGSANSRYDERRHLILDEANAIGTTYLRAELLPEAQRAAIQHILHKYVALRIEAVQTRNSMKEIERAILRSENMQAELWSRAVSVAMERPTPATALFLQALNEMIDLHQKRVSVALHHRVPGVLWVALYALVALFVVVGGYEAGAGEGRRSGTTPRVAVALALAVVLFLIAALDRPLHQLSTLDQSALIDLEQVMRQSGTE
jgi:hypothetical protein